MTFHGWLDAVMFLLVVMYFLKATFYRRMWRKEAAEHVATIRDYIRDLERYTGAFDSLSKHRPGETDTANEWPEEIR